MTTTMNTGAASLSDEQIRNIENDQAKMPGVTRENLTIRTVRAALIAQHGFCTAEDHCTCAREIGYRVCQPSSTALTPQADAAPIINGHAINGLFLKWSEWTTELGEAISRKNIDGFVSELRAAIAAGGAQEADVLEWIETELSAISCRYHGDPSYDHDAYWMKDRVMKLIADARKAFPLPRVAATVPSPIDSLAAFHAEQLESNPYCYFELAYTRQTGWMAWITDRPAQGEPGTAAYAKSRKVIVRGQGETAREACEDALSLIAAASTGEQG